MQPILSYPNHYMKSKSVLVYSHSNSVYDTTHDQSLFMTYVSVSIMFRELCADISHGCRSGKRLYRGQRERFPPIYDWLHTTGSLACVHLNPLWRIWIC